MKKQLLELLQKARNWYSASIKPYLKKIKDLDKEIIFCEKGVYEDGQKLAQLNLEEVGLIRKNAEKFPFSKIESFICIKKYKKERRKLRKKIAELDQIQCFLREEGIDNMDARILNLKGQKIQAERDLLEETDLFDDENNCEFVWGNGDYTFSDVTLYMRNPENKELWSIKAKTRKMMCVIPELTL